MKQIIWIFLAVAFAAQNALALQVRVVSIKGKVEIRRGLEEGWTPATAGLQLEDIDTIITGEAGEVVLDIDGTLRFTLQRNAILDISDLRRIGEKELFLYLMKEKVERLEKSTSPARLKIGQVSIVHGNNRDPQAAGSDPAATTELRDKEKNGVVALYQHQMYANAIVKAHKTLQRYPQLQDCGELRFYLGSAFAGLGKTGQAQQNWQLAIEAGKHDACSDGVWARRSSEALEASEQ